MTRLCATWRVAPGSLSSGTTTPDARRLSQPDVLQRILDALELPSTTRSDLLDSRKQVGREQVRRHFRH